LYSYRGNGYLLRDFVLMPDQFHIIPTPTETLEPAVQLIKGGFSRSASVELSSRLEIWQRGFSDHRICNASDYKSYASYIFLNPVKAKLSERAEDYRYGSASGRFEIDPLPQGLKPLLGGTVDGTAEAVPLQQQN
jgi:putative transposase